MYSTQATTQTKIQTTKQQTDNQQATKVTSLRFKCLNNVCFGRIKGYFSRLIWTKIKESLSSQMVAYQVLMNSFIMKFNV